MCNRLCMPVVSSSRRIPFQFLQGTKYASVLRPPELAGIVHPRVIKGIDSPFRQKGRPFSDLVHNASESNSSLAVLSRRGPAGFSLSGFVQGCRFSGRPCNNLHSLTKGRSVHTKGVHNAPDISSQGELNGKPLVEPQKCRAVPVDASFMGGHAEGPLASEVKTKPDGSAPSVPPASLDFRTMCHVFLTASMPMIGFGIMDQFVMIRAGDFIDTTLGVTFGLATLTAAAFGQLCSDTSGVLFGSTVDSFAQYLGFKPAVVSESLMATAGYRLSRIFGAAFGVAFGCLVGMTQLFFLDTSKADKKKRQKELDTIFHMVMSDGPKLFHCERATLFVYDESKNEIWSKAVFGLETAIRLSPTSRSFTTWVLENKEILNVNDAYEDYRFNPAYDQTYKSKTKSVLAAPVINESGGVVAVLMLFNKLDQDGGVFTEDDERMIEMMCHHVQIFMERFAYGAADDKRMISLKENMDILNTQASYKRKMEEGGDQDDYEDDDEDSLDGIQDRISASKTRWFDFLRRSDGERRLSTEFIGDAGRLVSSVLLAPLALLSTHEASSEPGVVPECQHVLFSTLDPDLTDLIHAALPSDLSRRVSSSVPVVSTIFRSSPEAASSGSLSPATSSTSVDKSAAVSPGAGTRNMGLPLYPSRLLTPVPPATSPSVGPSSAPTTTTHLPSAMTTPSRSNVSSLIGGEATLDSAVGNRLAMSEVVPADQQYYEKRYKDGGVEYDIGVRDPSFHTESGSITPTGNIGSTENLLSLDMFTDSGGAPEQLDLPGRSSISQYSRDSPPATTESRGDTSNAHNTSSRMPTERLSYTDCDDWSSTFIDDDRMLPGVSRYSKVEPYDQSPGLPNGTAENWSIPSSPSPSAPSSPGSRESYRLHSAAVTEDSSAGGKISVPPKRRISVSKKEPFTVRSASTPSERSKGASPEAGIGLLGHYSDNSCSSDEEASSKYKSRQRFDTREATRLQNRQETQRKGHDVPSQPARQSGQDSPILLVGGVASPNKRRVRNKKYRSNTYSGSGDAHVSNPSEDTDTSDGGEKDRRKPGHRRSLDMSSTSSITPNSSYSPSNKQSRSVPLVEGKGSWPEQNDQGVQTDTAGTPSNSDNSTPRYRSQDRHNTDRDEGYNFYNRQYPYHYDYHHDLTGKIVEVNR